MVCSLLASRPFARFFPLGLVLLLAVSLTGGSGCQTFHAKKGDSEPEIEGDSRMDRVGAGIRATLPYFILPGYIALSALFPLGDTQLWPEPKNP
jgi:hypothetical protein